jgi:hypothetical protein
MNIFPNSEGGSDSKGSRVSSLLEEWTPAARAAAAASRKKAGKGIGARQAASRKAYRDAGGTATGSGRIVTPKTDNITLGHHNKVIDYGHVHQLMQEKYGKGRGNKMYHDMINHPNADRGLHFVVGQKIQKEKLAMMSHLKLSGVADDHHYRALHSKWVSATRK